jgi:subtilase family serine protease
MNRVRHGFTLSMLAFAVVLSGCGIDAPQSAPTVPISPVVDASPTTPPVAESTTDPDLMIQEVSWTPRQPQPGDAVHFNVTVGYQGSHPVGLFTITYFINDLETGQDMVFQLEPGDSVTQTFTRHAPSEEFVVRIEVDSKSRVEEIDEINNTAAVVFSDSVVLTIGGVIQPLETPESPVFLGPDIVIHQMSWSPLNPKTGDAVSFNVTLKNQGDQPSGSFTTAYRVDGEQKSQSFVPSLAVNATANKTFSWHVLAIDYNISVAADSEGTVMESDETNNHHEVVFSDKPFEPPPPTVAANTSGKADLVIDSITCSPAVPVPGETASFSVIVRNRGDADAGSFVVNWYVTPVSAQQHRFQAFPELGAGNQTLSMNFDWQLPPGNTNLLFIVDQQDIVDEQNEDNNQFEISFADIELPDLMFAKITLEPESPSVGDNLTLTADILNDGNTNVAGFWLSVYLDGRKIRTSKIDGITAGGTANVSITWPAEAGENVLEAVIDEIGEIPERNEINKREQKDLPVIRLADLSVDEILWSPLNPFANEPCVFLVTVRNAGPGDAKPSQFTFSIDGVLRQSREIPSLAVGETWATTYDWTTEVGAHDISAAVDYGISPEVSKQNNSLDIVFSHTVTPLPDLVVSALSLVPASPAAGATVALHIEVSNHGSAASSNSLLRCYIDDQLETSITIWTVNAGQSLDTVHYFTVPAGVHNIRIVVDAMNNVAESREDNNSREMQFTVAD